MEYTIALTGNPNVGKTSLFNRMTHSSEHVGNWHGVTVAEKTKVFMYDHHKINMVDLPGLYSLTVYSFEEGVSRDNVIKGDNDLVINVCEVNNLSRNLYLALQLLELNVPLVLAVNMMDELKKQGKVFNYRKIEQALKIPIVPVSAKYHSDMHLLMSVSLDYLKNYKGNMVELSYLATLPINDVMSIISANAVNAGFSPRWAAIKVLERDDFVIDSLMLTLDQSKAIDIIGDWQADLAKARYDFIESITAGAISRNVAKEHREMHEHIEHSVPIEGREDGVVVEDKRTAKHIKKHDKVKRDAQIYIHGNSKIDRIVLNKYLALPIFLLTMAVIFVLTFGIIGKLMSDLLDFGIEKALYNPITSGLTKINTPLWIVDLVGEGIIHGVGGILTFLPQVVLLFFFLALLEDSGYISRVAFMTDGMFRKIGLSGRSAFTLLMGFGCSATAVLTARGLEDPMMRKKTVLLTPFLSCSARLPVYAVIGGAFFAAGQAFVIFGLYILGAIVALVLAAIFEKIKRLKSGKLSFIMEMPPYRIPTAERVMQIIWSNTKVFIVRVGTVIFALNVIVWMLANFSLTQGYTQGGANSILAVVGGWIAPAFTPLGFGNWQAVTSLMSGFVAKEVVVSTILSFGGVNSIFVGSYPALDAFSFLVFTLLYVPCVATVVAIAKEIGWRWALFSVVLQLGVAYIMALFFRSLGLLFIYNLGLAIGIVIVAVVGAFTAIVIAKMIIKSKRCGLGCGSCSKACTHRKDSKNKADSSSRSNDDK